MERSDLQDLLDTYPDKVADAERDWGVAEIMERQTWAKFYSLYRTQLADKKPTEKVIDAMIWQTPEYVQAAMDEKIKKSEHTRHYERLMATKKQSNLRTAY